MKKSAQKKNYTHISVRRWIRTHGHHKIKTSVRDALDHSATILCYIYSIIIGSNFTCWQQQKLWEVGTRTHKHLGKKLWLVIVVLHMAYLILVGEHCRNGFCWGFEVRLWLGRGFQSTTRNGSLHLLGIIKREKLSKRGISITLNKALNRDIYNKKAHVF